MRDETGRQPFLFFAPFVSSTQRIEPGWIDYNGHLNMAYYHVLFDRAVDEILTALGIDRDYVDRGCGSTFTAECHVVYRRELKLEDPVRVTAQLIGHDEKRLHYYMEMRHAVEGWLAATSENVSLHVDLTTRKVAPFPGEIRDALCVMKAAHGRMRRPEAIGRVMGIPLKSPVADLLRQPSSAD